MTAVAAELRAGGDGISADRALLIVTRGCSAESAGTSETSAHTPAEAARTAASETARSPESSEIAG